MTRSRFLLTCLLLAALAAPVRAGLFFNRQPKVDPSQRVPVLIVTLRTDADEHKRTKAAEELRHFDLATFPQIVSALSDAALNDPQSGVRSEAAQSLAHMRPVSQDAGWTLEQVAAKDASFRVRFQARNLLIQYRLAGYRSPKQETPVATTTVPTGPMGVTRQEPPLADPQGVLTGATMPAPSAPPVLVPAPATVPPQRVLTDRPVPIPPPADGPELSPSK
jgi:hypothetical protein